MSEIKNNYEAPLAIDLSAILPVYGGYCVNQSGAYYSDPETDE